MARIPIPKKVRFEVFKRDKFTCQYCGEKAPDVVLHIDHIKPVSKGGDNEIINLVTSCQGCNAGKGARELSDNVAITKQREQLEELEERRQQLEMMLEWRESFAKAEDEKLQILVKAISDKSNFGPNANGEQSIKRWLKRFEMNELLGAIDTSFEQYLVFDEKGEATGESWEKAFAYIPRIISVNRRVSENPHAKDLYYIRGILRNRLRYVNEIRCMKLLEDCTAAGATVESLREFAKTVSNWSDFEEEILNFIDDHGGVDGK